MDSQNHQQKAQKREKCGTERTKERILIYALRQEGGVSPQLGTCTSGDKFSAALCTSVKDCKSTTSTDLGVTNKFKLVGEIANSESMNNEYQPH